MKADIVQFFALQRRIFGICPECGDFFRLSDCKIFLKTKPVSDWMDEMEAKAKRIDAAEEKLGEQETELREQAREKGRRRALLTVKKIDPIFAPRQLNPDDAKVVFHPIDYIVFDGMKRAESIRNIVLLDRKAKRTASVQKSIERVVERGNYEWQTLRIQEDGKVKIE
jgi:predicted Holliday junction resolvase-like endonuclease